MMIGGFLTKQIVGKNRKLNECARSLAITLTGSTRTRKKHRRQTVFLAEGVFGTKSRMCLPFNFGGLDQQRRVAMTVQTFVEHFVAKK